MIAASLRAAEAPPPMHAAEIRLTLKKLDVLGRALYVATHPDDENTERSHIFLAVTEIGYRERIRQRPGARLLAIRVSRD
jgi:hypothetical protein